MKLTMIVYLHDTFHLTKDLDVTHRVWEGVVENYLQKSQKFGFFCFFSWNFLHYINVICDTLHCTASLVKVLYKSDLIWGYN